MTRNTDLTVPKPPSQSERRLLQMEQYCEQRRRHREWRRQKKRNGGRDLLAPPHLNPRTLPQPMISSEFTSNNWMKGSSFMVMVDPPPPSGCVAPPTNCAMLRRPVEDPKTPPPSSSSSFRRRNITGFGPISPPKTLRLASTKATKSLPRPDASPYYLRSSPPPLCFEYIGHPSLRVFKVKLPSFLANGPLDDMISAAESHVNRLRNGWRTDLYSLTKCDIACKDIPGISAYVAPISMYVCFAMQILYGCQKVKMDKNQPHILKYSAKCSHTGGKTICVMFCRFICD